MPADDRMAEISTPKHNILAKTNELLTIIVVRRKQIFVRMIKMSKLSASSAHPSV